MSKSLVGIAGVGGQIGSVHGAAFLALQAEFPDWGLAIQTSNDEVRAGNWGACRPNNLGVPIPAQVPMDGIAAYREFDELLEDPDVKLVVLATPTSTHHQKALKALAAKRHLLVEKPLAFTKRDSEEMLRAATSAQRYLFCGQILPWFADFKWLYELIRSSRSSNSDHKHGKLLRLHLFRHISASNHTADPANAELFGGPWLDLLSHDAHFLEAAVGSPSVVMAHGQRIGEFVKAANATYLFKDSPVVATVDCGATLTGEEQFEHGFTAQFERSTFVYGSNGPGLTMVDSNGALFTPGLPSGDALMAFTAQLRHALSVVDGSERDAGPLAAGPAAGAVALCHSTRLAVLERRAIEL